MKYFMQIIRCSECDQTSNVVTELWQNSLASKSVKVLCMRTRRQTQRREEMVKKIHPFFEAFIVIYSKIFDYLCGPGGSVGIATELRAGRSGIESPWERDFPPDKTCPGAHAASFKTVTGSFPGVKCGRGVLLTTHPLLVPLPWKSRAIPLPTLWATPDL